jgi:hypothetical protein
VLSHHFRSRLAVGIAFLAIAGLAPAAGGAHPGTVAGTRLGTVGSLDLGAAAPRATATPIQKAREALERAVTRFAQHRIQRGLDALATLRRTAGVAHRAAVNKIGKPPTDPESDELPGPPAAFAMLTLEHQIGVRLPPIFNRMRRERVLSSLGYTLWLTHRRRDLMLDKVIALNPEGQRAEYADGMADTLSAFTNEVKTLRNGLDTYVLTSSGRSKLTSALNRVKATRARVNTVFGGGE